MRTLRTALLAATLLPALLFDARPSHAATIDVAAVCASLSGTVWDPPTMTCLLTADRSLHSPDTWIIGSGVTLTVRPAVTLTIESGATLNLASGAKLINVEAVDNRGAIENDGSIENLGRITHILPDAIYSGSGAFSPPGQIGLKGDLSSSTVALSRFGPATVNIRVLSGDTLGILSSALLQVPSGYRFLNAGTIAVASDGNLTIDSGGTTENSAAIANDGTLVNFGILYNKLGATISGNGIENRSAAALYNLGTLNHGGSTVNEGTIENGFYFSDINAAASITFAAGAVLTNAGTLKNHAIITLPIVGGKIDNYNALENLGGTIDVGVGAGFGSPSIVNNSPATVSNQGLINVIRGSITNKNGATFTNTGTVRLSGNGILNNESTWNNNGSAVIDSAGTINNSSTLTNQSQAKIDNVGKILSDGAGKIVNHGTINNKKLGRFDNSATIENHGTFNNDHGKLDNLLSFQNDGVLNNQGFADPGDPENGHIVNHPGATLANAAGGTIDNREVIVNWSALTNGGTFVNRQQFDNNDGSNLNNLATVDNQGIVNNFNGATIATSGSFQNHILNAWCGGTVTGAISGNPLTSNCAVSGGNYEGDEPSCRALGGTYRTVAGLPWRLGRQCRVDNLTITGFFDVGRGKLEVAGVLGIGAPVPNAPVLIKDGTLEILPGAVFNNDSPLQIGCQGLMNNRGELNSSRLIETLVKYECGNSLDANGVIENHGTIRLTAGLNNGYAIYNHGAIYLASGSVIQNGPGLPLRRDPTAYHPPPDLLQDEVNSLVHNFAGGFIENRGEIINHFRTLLTNEGTIDNHGLLWNHPDCRLAPVGGALDPLVWGCQIDARGDAFLNNYGVVKNGSYGRITGSGESRFRFFAGSQFENDGLIRFDGDSIFESSPHAFFRNAAIWIFHERVVGIMEGTFLQYGAFFSGLGTWIRNLFSTSFHNYGTYVNAGTLDNTNSAMPGGGLFENLGTFANSGTIVNGNGRFANGSATASAATLVNTGSIIVGTGAVENFAAIETFSGATIQGTVTGTPPLSVNNFPPVASSMQLASTMDQALVIPLAATDSDGDPLTYRLAAEGPPGLGSVELNGNQATYRPYRRSLGKDYFLFVANDGRVDSNMGEVTITISGNDNADLASLALSSGRLAPTFEGDVTSYTVLVDETVSALGLTPIPADPDASVLVDGTVPVGNSSPPERALEFGANQLFVRVTAEDTTTSKTYGLVVTRATDSYVAPTATGSGEAGAYLLGGSTGCAFTEGQFLSSVPGANPPTPPGVSFPHGLFDFSLGGCTAGSTVEIRLVYPRVLPPGTQYWKYGPTPSDFAPHWYVMPADISGNLVSITISDGGLGDDDLTANGTIVDQGGPGEGVDTVEIPTLTDFGTLLLALLLASAAVVVLRLRQH